MILVVLTPGTEKAGLNRAILNTAPAAFLTTLGYKAEEAGAELILVNPHRHKPSQTCPACGRVEKKPLSQRVHTCACGLDMGRDATSATYMLDFGLRYRQDPASLRHYKAGNPAKAELPRRNKFAARVAAGAERPCAPFLAVPGEACASGH